MGEIRCRDTLREPADSPNNVTEFGSPPKAAIFFFHEMFGTIFVVIVGADEQCTTVDPYHNWQLPFSSTEFYFRHIDIEHQTILLAFFGL